MTKNHRKRGDRPSVFAGPGFPPSYVLATVIALVFAGVSVMGIAHSKDRVAVLLLAGILLLCVAAAIGSLWGLRTASRMTMSISASGIRVGDEQEIPWNEISSIRSRPFMRTAELLDRSGGTLASINGTMSLFASALEEVVEHMPPFPPTLSRLGVRRPRAYFMVSIAMVLLFSAIAVYLWSTGERFLGILTPPVLVWAFYWEMRDEIREVEIVDDRLTVRSFLRTWSYERREVASVHLTMRPQLCATLYTIPWRVRWVVARRADPLDVYRLIRRWHNTVAVRQTGSGRHHIEARIKGGDAPP